MLPITSKAVHVHCNDPVNDLGLPVCLRMEGGALEKFYTQKTEMNW